MSGKRLADGSGKSQTQNGKVLVSGTTAVCNCECCSDCADGVMGDVTLSLSGVTLCIDICLPFGIGGSQKYTSPTFTINSTFALQRESNGSISATSENACRWLTHLGTITHNIYSDPACTTLTSSTTIDVFVGMIIVPASSGGPYWQLKIGSNLADTVFAMNQGLFFGIATFTDTCHPDTLTFSNQNSGGASPSPCCTPHNAFECLAFGGTAVVTNP